MDFLIGCAVWSHKGWVGELFPPKTRQSQFLQLYSQHFDTVEGNTTFYATPNSQTINRWIEQTSPKFKFCPKLPRHITHNGKLQPLISQALEFAEIMRPLGSRLGPIFAQLPPSYHPHYLEDLTVFLAAWKQTQLPLAVEVRHRDWFQPINSLNLNLCLEAYQVGRVILDTRPIYTEATDGEFWEEMQLERKKPQLPIDFSLTAPFTFVRFISHPILEVNLPFMQEWVIQIQAWLQDATQIYFFVHCPQEDFSPRNAKYLQSLLEIESDFGF